jgi:hypothetical protein
MKFNQLFILAVLILLTIPSFAQTTYFIKYKSDVPIDVVESNISEQKLSNSIAFRPLSLPEFNINYLAKGFGRGDEVLGRIVKVQFLENVDEANFSSMLSSDTEIEYIQKSTNYQLDFIPNDSLLSQQWALQKINAFNAWDITQGVDSIIVAVIDMGMDYNHLDLINNIYQNNGEIGIDNFGNDKRINGVDDDSNGFVDDFRGWDFTDMVGFPYDSTAGDYLEWDNDPYDDIKNSFNAAGHGTQVAGVIAAEQNNLFGISGAAPNVKVLNIRSFSPEGTGQEDDAAAAILYSIKMGAKVINMSWGDYSFSYVLRDVIRYAYSQNIVLIASAGNRNSDQPHYPSGYSEVISVSGTNSDDFLAGYNWGSTIDLVAPAIGILTTHLNSEYKPLNGTSFAAPYVAAAAALILSKQNFNNEEIKQILKSTTDDIGEPGWDIKSGSGRLNLFNALSVTAPSNIKFYNPLQDFALMNDTLKIVASILSPYFTSYKLEYGIGISPKNWITLIENGQNQFSKQEIYKLNTASLSDTVYTLRIFVYQNNGRTLEERVNFHVDRTAPKPELVNILPAYYGDKLVPLASVYTDDLCIVKMYYRKLGESNFNYLTLDGFSTNNQFVKQLHYGFIPRDLAIQNTEYEIYFEAENLVGLKTEIKNQGGYFLVSTQVQADFSTEIIQPFSLPSGDIYENPINITSDQKTNISLRNGENSDIYSFENDSFVLVDTLKRKYVRDFGDFNNNGLTDLLSYFTYNGYIEEQTSNLSASFTTKESIVSNGGEVRCWPILADDVDLDGIVEVFSLRDLNRVEVWHVESNLKLKIVDTLLNFTPNGFGGNIINSPGAALSDIDDDGTKEIWMVDQDGDLFSYEIGLNEFREQFVIRTGFLGDASYLTSGDYNGDGKAELAVLLHSVSELDIAPFYRLIVFNMVDSSLNILFDKAFIDASDEFNGAFRRTDNSIRFADINNDSKDELILFTFPYAYIFRLDGTNNTLISYKENINSNAVFIGDLNQNGVLEVAFPYSNKIEFLEFATSNYTSTPYDLSGYSISSTTVQLSWISSSPKYYIYKGLNKNNLELVDSTSISTFYDIDIVLDSTYYYAIKAFDSSKSEPLSGMSNIVEVFVHNPGKPVNAVSNSNRSVIVTFSEKMKNTIENLQAFNIVDVGYPNSVTANDQYSYLLSYTTDLPEGEQKVIIQNIKDFYNSPIEKDSLTFTVTPIIEVQTFFVSNFEIINSYKIKLTFNYPVEENLAINTSNYTFEPYNKVSSVIIAPNDSKTIYLDLTGNKPVGSIGKEYVLRINNLQSDAFSGNIPINTGAGSYVVLSTFAKDLSDVYVYPNPTKEGTEKITFANLPQRAKISIWTMDGILINEIEETDGNGGVDYSLIDLGGNKISTGIYFYRIVQLDEMRNEGEEKLGKFAVVR